MSNRLTRQANLHTIAGADTTVAKGNITMHEHEDMDYSQACAMQIEHACGHLHTHLVPKVSGSGGSLLLAVEMLASHACPACLAGAPDWAIDPTIDSQPAPSAGSC